MWPLILPDNKHIVFYSPRSACSVVKNWFLMAQGVTGIYGQNLPNMRVHEQIGYRHDASDFLLNDKYLKAIVVRDPIRRFISTLRKTGMDANKALECLEKGEDIEHHFEPQYKMFDRDVKNVRSYFDRVIRIEDEDLVQSLNEWYGASIVPFRINESECPSPVLSPEQEARVRRIYELDYENFYSEKLPPEKDPRYMAPPKITSRMEYRDSRVYFIPGNAELPFPRYEKLREYCKDKIVADIACGCGYGSYILGKDARQVYGFDFSPYAIEFAGNNWSRSNVRFETFNLVHDTFHIKFDCIISCETIEHISIPIAATLKKFKEYLVADGILGLTYPEQEKRPSEYHCHYGIKTDDMVKMLEEMGFQILLKSFDEKSESAMVVARLKG